MFLSFLKKKNSFIEIWFTCHATHHLECTSQCFLVYSQSCANIATIPLQNFLILQNWNSVPMEQYAKALEPQNYSNWSPLQIVPNLLVTLTETGRLSRRRSTVQGHLQE